MQRIRALVVGACSLSVCLFCLAAEAAELATSSTVAMQWADDQENGGKVLVVTLAAQERSRDDLPVFVGVEFTAPLPVGSIVELWTTAPEAATLPWQDEVQSSGRKVQHWVVNEFTEETVRLNVTRFVRELSAAGGSRTFYVRVLDDLGDPIKLETSEVSSPELTEVSWRK